MEKLPKRWLLRRCISVSKSGRFVFLFIFYFYLFKLGLLILLLKPCQFQIPYVQFFYSLLHTDFFFFFKKFGVIWEIIPYVAKKKYFCDYNSIRISRKSY